MQKKMTGFYVRTLATYWIIILVIISIMMPVYASALENAKKVDIKEEKSHIQAGLSGLQKRLEYIAVSADAIFNQNEIQFLKKTENNSKELPSLLYEAYSNKLRIMWAITTESELVTVQFCDNDVVITNNAIYNDSLFFYNNFFGLNEMDHSEWKDMIWNEKPNVCGPVEFYLSDKNVNEIGILMNYYYPSARKPDVCVSYYLSADSLTNVFLSDRVAKYGHIQMSLKSGKKTATIEKTADLYKDNAIPLLEYEGTTLSVSVLISETAFKDGASSVRYALMMYILIAIGSAILLSCAIVFINAKPVRGIVNMIYDRKLEGTYLVEKKQNVYQYIISTLNSLADTCHDMNASLEILHEDLSRALIRLLIAGAKVREDVISEGLSEICVFRAHFCAVAMQTKTDAGCAERMILEAKILAAFPEAYVCEDAFTYFFLPAMPQEDAFIPERLIRELETWTENERNNVFLGVSTCVSSVHSICQAAKQARKALLRAKDSSYLTVSVYMDEKPGSKGQIMPPFDTERFSWMIQSGDENGIKRYFELLTLAMSDPELVEVEKKLTYYAILNVLKNHLAAINKSVALQEYDPYDSIESNIHALMKHTEEVSFLIKEEKKKEKDATIKNILSYIQTHISSYSLSLTQIADEFNVSERHLYLMILEKTGMSYIDYVMSLRMGEAQRLLVQTNMPVKDIAACVGYEYANSFYKVFRKKVGMSPVEFREKNR